MSAVRGKDFKLYRNSDSPYDNSPTWVEMDNAKDVTRTLEKALADASTRASTFRQQVSTLLDLTIAWQMVYNDTDTHLQAFEDAFYDETPVEMLALDGSINTAGSRGIRFMAQISKFTINEALEDVGTVDIEVVPAYYPTNLPRRVEVNTPGSVDDV